MESSRILLFSHSLPITWTLFLCTRLITVTHSQINRKNIHSLYNNSNVICTACTCILFTLFFRFRSFWYIHYSNASCKIYFLCTIFFLEERMKTKREIISTRAMNFIWVAFYSIQVMWDGRWNWKLFLVNCKAPLVLF